jgi:hypothetical protein
MTGALLILGISVTLLIFYVIKAARQIWRVHRNSNVLRTKNAGGPQKFQ